VPGAVDVSICILTRNQPELLERCVASCVQETAANGLRAEIIIIDNASIDGGPRRVAGLFPGVRIIRNEYNLGFAAANNKAIRSSQGRSLLILNDDAVLLPGSLGMMAGKLYSEPRIGAVGPKLLNPDGSLQRGFTNRRFPHLRGLACGFLGLSPLLEKNALARDLLTHSKDPQVSAETDHLAGACLLVRREAFDDVGLFHEGFYYFFEDTDLCYRLQQGGWKIVYLAEAHVVHYGSASFRKLVWSEKNIIYLRSLLYFFKEHSGRFKYTLLRTGLTVVLLLHVPIAWLAGLRASGPNRGTRSRSVKLSLEGLRSIALGGPIV
jgi:N-acetylglucosaminyl-diphospho-decaprenol L-rhamnosyltransferase